MDAPLLPALPGYDNPELIAHGTTALVFRATQTRLNRSVAIKVITADTGSIPVNAERELATTVALSSQPHIVSIIDTGVTADDRPYIVMEYCEGGSYAQILKSRGPLPVDDVLEVGVKIGEALHAAHTVGIVHRDVKPSNILRSRFGPALTDFGIARAPDELGSTLTREMMTPHHASPEALLHQAQSGLSDVYSLASTLWTLLIGHPPFVDPTRPALDMHAFRDRVLHDPLPSMPREDVPAWLIRELAKAMSKLPSQRHGSAFEFAEALRRGALGLDPTPRPAVDLGTSVHLPGLPATAWPIAPGPSQQPAPMPPAPASPWATFATGVRESEPAPPSEPSVRPDAAVVAPLPLFAAPDAPPAPPPAPAPAPVAAAAPVAPVIPVAPAMPVTPVSTEPSTVDPVWPATPTREPAPVAPLRPLEPLPPLVPLAPLFAEPEPAPLSPEPEPAPVFTQLAPALPPTPPVPMPAPPVPTPPVPMPAPLAAPLFTEAPAAPLPAPAPPGRPVEFAARPTTRSAPTDVPAPRPAPTESTVDEGGWQSGGRTSTVEIPPPPAPRIVVSDVDSPHRSRRGVLVGALVGLVSIALIVGGVLFVVGMQHRNTTAPPPTGQTSPASGAPTVSPNAGEPGGPTDVAIADHGTAITVSWVDPTPSHTVSFVVTMSTSASTAFQSQTLSAGTTSATFNGLSRTAKYCVQVVALYGISNAPRSAIVCTTPTRS
jgi:serine/threonine protein kinase